MATHQSRSRPAGKNTDAATNLSFSSGSGSHAFDPVLLGIVGTAISIGALGAWLHSVPFVLANAWVIVVAISLSVAAVTASWLFSFVLREQLKEKKLNHLLTLDPLTNLLNRRSFETRLSLEWDRARRRRTPLALLAIDVDHFGRFNNTYGCLRGDDALVAIAQCIEEAGRPYECNIARFGGDQFAVLLTGPSAGKVTELATAIRAMVERVRIRHCASVFQYITVSVGSATSAQLHEVAPADLLAAAGVEMQEAKMCGRNQTCSTTLSKSATSWNSSGMQA